MQKTTTAALQVRLEVLSLAMQEIARALSPAQAAQITDAVRQRVAALAERPLSTAADEAITADLVPLLAALRVPAEPA